MACMTCVIAHLHAHCCVMHVHGCSLRAVSSGHSRLYVCPVCACVVCDVCLCVWHTLQAR